MTAALDNLSVIKDNNIIAKSTGKELMTDIHCRFISYDIVELGVNLILCDWIQIGGGFIQNDKRGIFVKRSS